MRVGSKQLQLRGRLRLPKSGRLLPIVWAGPRPHVCQSDRDETLMLELSDFVARLVS